MDIIVRPLGLIDYSITWEAMRRFTDTRTGLTEDELWCLEHPPVFTLGLGGKHETVLMREKLNSWLELLPQGDDIRVLSLLAAPGKPTISISPPLFASIILPWE
jgi:hypothetical protein